MEFDTLARAFCLVILVGFALGTLTATFFVPVFTTINEDLNKIGFVIFALVFNIGIHSAVFTTSWPYSEGKLPALLAYFTAFIASALIFRHSRYQKTESASNIGWLLFSGSIMIVHMSLGLTHLDPMAHGDLEILVNDRLTLYAQLATTIMFVVLLVITFHIFTMEQKPYLFAAVIILSVITTTALVYFAPALVSSNIFPPIF